MKKTMPVRKTLQLSKQTLANLTPRDLRAVDGARINLSVPCEPTNSCYCDSFVCG